jgi:hypothetical protein
MALLATAPALGLIQGGVTLGVPGPLAAGGTAMEFNGSTGYISVPATPLFSPEVGDTGELTLETWFYPLASGPSGNGAILVGKGNYNTGWEYGLMWNTSDVLNFIVFNTAGTDYMIVSSPALSLDTAYHLVAVFENASPLAAIYVNAVVVGTSDVAAAGIAPSVTASSITIGMGDDGYVSGRESHVAIYRYALSPTRVAAHTAAGQSATPGVYAATVLADSPLAYWPLTELTGVVAGDRANLAAVEVLEVA